MKSVIYGSGANSIVTLYRIHQGGCYFKKDTSTSHSQIKKLQSQLNTMGFDCGTADGKYGDKTVAGVKAFQKAHNLTRDGLFGKASLEALEAELNQSGAVHFDSNCENSSDIGAYGCYDKADDAEIHEMTEMAAVDFGQCAISNQPSFHIPYIYAYLGEGSPLRLEEFMQNLENDAADTDVHYNDEDCAGYVYVARNSQGAKGATSEFTQQLKFFGSIKDLGGYDKLIPGMELFQGYRKTPTSNQFYSSHIGVYAGKQTLQGTLMPAVYQSSSSYPSLEKRYDKTSGPNLTKLGDSWNYWGWSKFIRLR